MACSSRLFLLILLPALGMLACRDSVDSSGHVLMGQWGPEPNTQVWTTATFHRGLQDTSCKAVATSSGCTVSECWSTDAGVGDGFSLDLECLDAGTVTIRADQTITLSYARDGFYSGDPSAPAPVSHAGQAIEVEIAGNHGDPPGISLTYTAPGQLELTSPMGSSFTFDRAQGASFTWTPSHGETVQLGMATYGLELTCEWPMADGRGTVPSSLLSRFPATTTTAFLHAQTIHVADRGRWRIQAGAFAKDNFASVTLR